MSCPSCGHEDWHGWDERIMLGHAIGSGGRKPVGRGVPAHCANCGFIRLQPSHVLDDPRDPFRNARST